jgi:hypothetical protein
VSDLILEKTDDIKRINKDNETVRQDNERLKENLDDSFQKYNQVFISSKNEIDELRTENERLEKRVDRFRKALVVAVYLRDFERNKVSQLEQLDNIILSQGSDIKTLTTQKETFKAEAERLQRALNSAETNYLQQYHNETGRLGKELAIANQTIHELRDKQTFLQPELVMVTQNDGVPKNYKGWTTQTDQRGYIRLFKKMSGVLHQFYFGRNWDAEKADKKIAAYTEKNLDRLKFVIRKDADEQLPVPMAFRFEDSLRLCCPEQRRTYRLDKVRLRFNGMQKSEFDRNMLSLASQYKIELVGGDPRECDMDALIRDDVMGITYVNFEWRA